ncbi:MAG: Jag N-terminal domain-containing protein [Candidatus Omnitrophota bacterium]
MAEQTDDKEPVLNADFEGNTVEEAIEAALAELNIAKDNIKIQILTEGTRGLFGMQGAKKAKIRVTILSQGDEK